MNKAISILLMHISFTVTAKEPVQGDRASTPAITREEVQQASLILIDVADQMRIAQAKLEKQSIERNKQMGRLKAWEAVAAEVVEEQAAKTQHRVERHQQITEQLGNLAKHGQSRGVDDARLKTLLARSQADVDTAKERLEKVSRLRVNLQEKLVELKAEHLTHLLEASVKSTPPDEDPLSSIERLMDAELQRK